MKNVLFLTVFIFIICVSTYAQTFTAYADAEVIGGGFSYNVEVSVSQKGERNSALNAGAYTVKLISVKADSKGYYHKGKTNRYFPCAQLGNICNPDNYRDVFIGITYECNNVGLKQIRFTRIGEEQTISLRQDAGTECNFKLDKVKVSLPQNFSEYSKRISEIEYPK